MRLRFRRRRPVANAVPVRKPLDPRADEAVLLAALVADADRKRDAGDAAGAADAYARVLRDAPWRTDLVVQQGNMCKDCGRLPEAERLYGAALADDPENADIHLQFGHVMKLMGRRSRALACYRRALELEPGMAAAQLELVQAGVADAQGRAITAQLRGHGIERMLALAGELSGIRGQLDRMERMLPDLAAWTAIPIERYDLFRRLFDVPPPDPTDGSIRFRVVISADEGCIDRLHRQLMAFRSATEAPTEIVVFGSGADARATVERLATANGRLRWQQALPGEAAGAQEARACENTSGWLLFPGTDAVPHRLALAWLAAAITPGTGLLFCDEEHVAAEAGRAGRDYPVGLVARWCFDPELLLQSNAFGDSLAVSADRWAVWSREIDPRLPLSGRRSALLLAMAMGGGYGTHVPFPLMATPVPNPNAERARLRCHHLVVGKVSANRGFSVAMPADNAPRRLVVFWPARDADAPITVVIPTRNHGARCRLMVESLFALARAPHRLRCLVIDNGSDQPDTLAHLDQLVTDDRIEVRRMPGPFNWSRLNNDAATMAGTPLLAFANDDMQMLSEHWDDRLRGLLQRPEVGVVGAKLLYPDGTMQHGGILLGWQGSVIHDGLHEPSNSSDQLMRWQSTRRVSAVTGAFLAVRGQVFRDLGGFDAEHLPIGYSDVDLCLRARRSGLHVLWSPDIILRHDESVSRGLDHLDDERQARDRTERSVMTARWDRLMLDHDPTVNPIWLDATLPFRLLRTTRFAARSHAGSGGRG